MSNSVFAIYSSAYMSIDCFFPNSTKNSHRNHCVSQYVLYFFYSRPSNEQHAVDAVCIHHRVFMHPTIQVSIYRVYRIVNNDMTNINIFRSKNHREIPVKFCVVNTILIESQALEYQWIQLGGICLFIHFISTVPGYGMPMNPWETNQSMKFAHELICIHRCSTTKIKHWIISTLISNRE